MASVTSIDSVNVFDELGESVRLDRGVLKADTPSAPTAPLLSPRSGVKMFCSLPDLRNLVLPRPESLLEQSGDELSLGV